MLDMVTFSVTIDEEAHSDLFIQMMEELKFVVSVAPATSLNKFNPIEYALQGPTATEEELGQMIVLSEDSETYTPQKSRKLNKQRFDQWPKKSV